MMGLSPCVATVTHSNITVSEKGRRANFRNPENELYQKARVDGCLVTSGVRCDWIVTKIGVGSVLVELKGSDIAHAFDQLLATLQHVHCKCWLEKRRAMLVVCSKYPAFDTGRARREEVARKKGLRLKVVCNEADLHIEELLPKQ